MPRTVAGQGRVRWAARRGAERNRWTPRNSSGDRGGYESVAREIRRGDQRGLNAGGPFIAWRRSEACPLCTNSLCGISVLSTRTANYREVLRENRLFPASSSTFPYSWARKIGFQQRVDSPRQRTLAGLSFVYVIFGKPPMPPNVGGSGRLRASGGTREEAGQSWRELPDDVLVAVRRVVRGSAKATRGTEEEAPASMEKGGQAMPKSSSRTDPPTSSKGLTQDAPASKTTTKRKGRKKSEADVCLKAYWGIYNDHLQRVALFEHSDRRKAERTARELTKSKRGSFFVRAVKETVRRSSEDR